MGISANLGVDLLIPINNYEMDSGSSDWVERVYIFGRSPADLVDAKFNIAPDGTATITDIIAQPRVDNFDFTSGTGLAQTINNLLLRPALDLYGLGTPAVNIVFSPASALSFDGDGIYTLTCAPSILQSMESPWD